MADIKERDLKKHMKSHEDVRSNELSAGSQEFSIDERIQQIGLGVTSGSINIDRDEYLQAHRDLAFERNILQTKNNIYHRRLSEYYKKRKLEHVLKPIENCQDLEEKYQSKLIAYEELKEKDEREIADINAKLATVQNQYEERLDFAESTFQTLQQLERSTGSGLIYSMKGKPIPDKTVESLLKLQRNKSTQCSTLRLRYIRARNAVAELDAIVKKLETIGPGLSVAQYEQLHIDNQNYMNKIEEREDELIKNRGKCTEHNQILAHIREKMHHTDEVIDITECDMGDAEMEFLRAREDLGSVKSRRDRLRWNLEGERIKAGLLTRRDLLRDFQNATDEVVQLRKSKEMFEKQIAQTTEQLREARKRVTLHYTSQGHGIP